MLAGLGGPEDAERSIYMMDAKENSAFAALTKASFALRKGQYKLICYRGFSQYGGKDQFELYDLQNDPAELNDLYSETSHAARALRDELLTKVQSVSLQIAA